MKRISPTLACIALLPALSVAATDGTLGATSTATAQLSLQAQAGGTAQIRISGLSDFNWGLVNTSSIPAPLTDGSVCVYMSQPGTYQLSIQSANAQSLGAWDAFDGWMGVSILGLRVGVAYNWTFSDRQGSTVTSGIGTGLVPSSTADCTGAFENARLTITPTTQPAAGSHLDTITLFVFPE